MKESQIEEFRGNIKLYNATKDYLNKLIIPMEERIALEVSKRYGENDLLKYFRENLEERKRFQTLLDDELNWVKANRPDIVQSWKYYQEFVRMCEGDEAIEK